MVGAAVPRAGRNLTPTVPHASGASVTLLDMCRAGNRPAAPCRTPAADMLGAAMTGARGYHAVALPHAGGTPVLPLAMGWTVARSTCPGTPPGLGRQGEQSAVDLRAAASHNDVLDESLTVVDDYSPSPPLVKQLF
jgi:hypothetical protein